MNDANKVGQIYNSTVTQMSACLLSLAVTSLLLPVSTVLGLSISLSSQYLADSISRFLLE